MCTLLQPHFSMAEFVRALATVTFKRVTQLSLTFFDVATTFEQGSGDLPNLPYVHSRRPHFGNG